MAIRKGGGAPRGNNNAAGPHNGHFHGGAMKAFKSGAKTGAIGSLGYTAGILLHPATTFPNGVNPARVAGVMGVMAGGGALVGGAAGLAGYGVKKGVQHIASKFKRGKK